MNDPKPKRRSYQFSLRTLLIVVTLCAIPCSWLAVKMQQAKRERESAAAIEKLGGRIQWSKPSSDWLRTLFGDNLVQHVSEATSGFPDGTAILPHLRECKQLRRLTLWGVNIDNTLSSYLREFEQLQTLTFQDTRFTDAGFENLKGLSQLKELSFIDTSVTNEDVKKLRQALPNCHIQVLESGDPYGIP